jgi:hypothetical protein
MGSRIPIFHFAPGDIPCNPILIDRGILSYCATTKILAGHGML